MADRLQVRHGRQGACAAHLYFDVFEHRRRLARRIFERDGPARRLGRPAKLFLLLDGIDLDHHAVDFVGQVSRLSSHSRMNSSNRRARRTFVDADYFETRGFERFRDFPSGCQKRAAIAQQEISEVIELASGRDRRDQAPATLRPRRCADSRNRGKPRLAFLIQTFEGAALHDDFAAHFERSMRSRMLA